MALSQRPASRFFAAFYRWNQHAQRPRSCAVTSQYPRRDAHPRNSICALRYYNTTRLLQQQSHSPPQSPDEDATELGEHASYLSGRGGERIFRPAESIREEIADTQEIVEEQDAPFELPESELQKEQLKTSVRELMRNVPSSVAVLTVKSIDPDTRKYVPMGVAVSSLSTVTLDPPTISFNIKEPSKTLDAIRAAGGLFRVHYPTANRGGAKLVDLFCRGNHSDAYSLRSKELKVHQPQPIRTRRLGDPPPSLAPQILGQYVRAAMECKVTHEFPIADHVILVARVDSLEQTVSKDPAIMYINGGYRSPEGESIYAPTRAQFSAVSEATVSVWDYPLFPGEKERRHYMEQIKTMVKANPAYHETPSGETYRNIESKLPYAAANFGISMELLVAECRQELGLPRGLRSDVDGQQVLSDFYGVLTPSMRDQIVDRAKKLVAMDARFLSQNYRVFLHNLGVNPSSRDFLPSDIMEPLRKANLAPPFDPRRGHVNGSEDIVKVEQTEYHLRGYLQKMDYHTALGIPLEEAMEAIGERKTAARNFRKARSRLLTQSHPALFDASAIDIAGEVSHEELRVVLCRVINRLHINSLTRFRSNIVRDWREIFRRAGVNPTVSGMDVEFMMGKIKHLYYSTTKFSDFSGAVEDMLRPWFIWDVSWEDLEGRVKHFVENIPLRATTWTTIDRLAAMGLHWDAMLTIPGSNPSKQANKQWLSKGAILDTLVAKELKNYYGRGSEEENQAIAKYLKETYDFDVTHKPIQYQPAASASQSSADEMQQAMLTSLETDQEQAWFEDGISGRSLPNQGGAGRSRKADGSSRIRRIESDQELVRRTVHKGGYRTKRRSDKKHSEEGWGTYSFIAGQNP